MGALFGRVVTLDIGPVGGQGRQFSGIRINFDVTMSKASTPNKAVIEAYNLGPESLALAQAPGALFRLLVGYASDIPRVIFTGTATKDGIRLDRSSGVDTVLHLEAQDGGATYTTARASRSFATQTSSRQVFDYLAGVYGQPLGTVRVPSHTFPHGIVLTGNAKDCLADLADTLGCEVYTRDGVLHFHEAGGTTGETAIVFSAEAGNLIGSPTPKKGGIEVKALISPTLRPGKPFVVRSRDITGEYIATDVQFKGDSGWATEFYVTVSGTPRS